VFGLSKLHVVDEESGALHPLKGPRTLNTEAVAVDRDGVLYVFSDTNSKTSAAKRATCKGWSAPK